ncbi:MAG TPA: DUF1540 domain-containing protein [Bacillota bacterium]|jgi:hypothetical protein
MPNPEVKCSVDTCAHWLPGEVCGAGNIDILDRQAKNADDTKCKTFYLRSSVANAIGALDNINWSGAIREPFQEGLQLTPSVTCVVEGCAYWSSGDHCDARSIRVTGDDANQCEETDCQTFESKGGR